jgi:hypothetical protein
MEALMYGMIPSANIVALDSAPPENMSKKPIRAPPLVVNNALSASLRMPGVGI